jgi:nucleoside-diphosphate-sugar epimerase
MRILLIGGTGFIGPHIARILLQDGHQVAVFHRGRTVGGLAQAVEHFAGNRNALAREAPRLHRWRPDVVVDLLLSSGPQARVLTEVFRGTARRLVAVSSMDVYRACGVLHQTEPGPLESLPLTEDSPLRQNPPYPPEQVRVLQGVFAWLDDQYDKVAVEHAILDTPDAVGSVVRLPMVYGPGDPLHRLYPLLKRMDDRRPALLLAEEVAAWRGPRGYVENIAAAIALVAVHPQAGGRVFNVAEEPPVTEREWAELVATEAGWHGRFVVLPHDRTPEHLLVRGNLAQHWVVSTRRIREELGYREPVPRSEGLKRSIAWQRRNPPATVDPAQFDYVAEDAALRGTEG